MVNTAGPVCENITGRARTVALIGPTGVGKTTTIAKLAANFKLRQNKKVGLITIDTYRIGAVDQLRTYAQIIDVPLRVVVTPNDLAEAIEMMSDMDVILIDTAGRSQTDKLKIRELQTFLDAAAPDEVHLVLSTTTHHAHMLSAAEEFSKLGVDRIILTKLDEAIGFGVVLSVLRNLDASLSYITTGQDVPDDIEVGSGRELARKLLGLASINNNKNEIQQETYA
jgi:flagellar biosynthesis protein FlhF